MKALLTLSLTEIRYRLVKFIYSKRTEQIDEEMNYKEI